MAKLTSSYVSSPPNNLRIAAPLMMAHGQELQLHQRVAAASQKSGSARVKTRPNSSRINPPTTIINQDKGVMHVAVRGLDGQ